MDVMWRIGFYLYKRRHDFLEAKNESSQWENLEDKRKKKKIKQRKNNQFLCYFIMLFNKSCPYCNYILGWISLKWGIFFA